MLSDDQREKLRTYFQRQREVAAAFLFGSQATGTAHAESDVDIAVLLRRGVSPQAAWDWQLGVMGDLEDLLGVRKVDVVLLHECSPLLRYQVARDGKVLFERDGAVARFRRRAWSEYFDLEPLRQKRRATRWRRLRDGTFGTRLYPRRGTTRQT
ncbi:MAG: nucleotidyltransferase domain-containing protein [Abditibacteriales bacterium]|nr:nucleotidyltransferase domain-containing protein [Abditibacteriales bacterium]MDW8367786.1 nucleotidyltransferase domain-containing protein [Abditibacteriales bacterium]